MNINKLINLSLEYPSVDINRSVDQDTSHYFIIKEDHKLLKLFIEKGANLENKAFSFTPLELAIHKSDIKSIQLLLKNGAQLTDVAKLKLNHY